MSKPVAHTCFAWLIAGILMGFSAQAWAYSGDTIQDDIAREFNGATSYTIPLSAPTDVRPSATCTEKLDNELQNGQIPLGDQCSCPTGATQPVCMSNSSLCQTNLLVIQERMGSGYECSCPSGDSEPQCTSFYDLCEEALPSYQSSTEHCSCSTGATSAVPECTYVAPPPPTTCERCTTNRINCSIPISGTGPASSDHNFIDKADWPDPEASWVYGTAAGCESNVPNGVTSTVEGVYYNTTGSTIDATLYFAADDKGTVSINGTQVASYNDGGYWGTRAYPATGGVVSDPVEMPPGQDKIIISITNDSVTISGNNGSMAIMAIMKNNQALISTNTSWSVYPMSQTCREYPSTSPECTE